MALHHLEPREKVHLPAVDGPSHGKTSPLVKTDRFEAVQLLLRAGDRIADHAVAGYATLHCLEGSALIDAGAKCS